jgi:putative FmdB family regulatory protein
MPLYEYECEACATRMEKIRKFSDPPLVICEACGGALRKLVSSPAIQFKGTGWYITDYAKKTAVEGTTGGKPGDSATAGGEKGETQSGTSKSEGRSEGKSEGGSSASPSSPTGASSGDSKS